MIATLTIKGQVTIPKQIRDALDLRPGCQVDFAVNDAGEVVIHRAEAPKTEKIDRFEAARGKAEIRWTTAELMKLLRSD